MRTKKSSQRVEGLGAFGVFEKGGQLVIVRELNNGERQIFYPSPIISENQADQELSFYAAQIGDVK
jgi:hypothetical protein